jgi:iron complex transport system ATP-binding protein
MDRRDHAAGTDAMTSILTVRAAALSGRLQPTSLELNAGELVALVGPNGGGKTSLLRSLADAERHSGSVLISGEDLTAAPPARRASLLAFLPASREVVWPISARDVIALSSPALKAERIDALVDLLEIRPFADRPINSLSTGERARVLLARALAPEPRLLLLDEPLSNLDPYWALRIVEILRAFVSNGEHAALVALHDLGQAEAFDRMLLVNDGQLLADGVPATVLTSPLLSETFGIERLDGRWQIRRLADPQSLQ